MVREAWERTLQYKSREGICHSTSCSYLPITLKPNVMPLSSEDRKAREHVRRGFWPISISSVVTASTGPFVY